MATHKSALKRIRQNEKKYQRNLDVRSLVKSRVRKVRETIQAKTGEEARTAFIDAVHEIDKAWSKGVLKRNTASRKISRLAKKLNSLKTT